MSERMSRVIRYIERNLDADIDVSALSKIACYSEYHFHRLFRAYVGESVYAYKKRLLLERAVRHLRHSDDNITEISFKCGYENQASFNKAFKKQFSYTPGQVRQQMVSIDLNNIKANPKRSIKMKAEIKQLDDIHVICARETGPYAESAGRAWTRIMQFAYSNRLMNKDVRAIGISHDNPNVTEAEHIRFDACVDIDADISAADDLNKSTIAGGKYAMFLHKGAYENFPQAYAYIFNEWLPANGHRLRDRPCFEIYLNRDPRRTKPENLRTEIYIPLV